MKGATMLKHSGGETSRLDTHHSDWVAEPHSELARGAPVPEPTLSETLRDLANTFAHVVVALLVVLAAAKLFI
jgi:hypothetical protein